MSNSIPIIPPAQSRKPKNPRLNAPSSMESGDHLPPHVGMPPLIAPSILAADFTRLGEEVEAIDLAGADFIHLDVMDGHFVPNISFGLPIIAALRPLSKKPFDVHLMISAVDPYLEKFANAGADIITIHAEISPHLDRSLSAIRGLGKRAGIALTPSTPESAIEYVMDKLDLILVMTVNPGFGGQAFIPAMTEKIRRLRDMIGTRPILLEVDGGITAATAPMVIEAGAHVLVAGSSVFGACASDVSDIDAYRQAIMALRG